MFEAEGRAGHQSPWQEAAPAGCKVARTESLCTVRHPAGKGAEQIKSWGGKHRGQVGTETLVWVVKPAVERPEAGKESPGCLVETQALGVALDFLFLLQHSTPRLD